MNRSTLTLLLLLSACQFGDGFQDYYGGGPAPEISGLSATSQEGNIGGATVVITGSNFGGDPDAITVVFGSGNARILRVEGSEIEVEVPDGPIEGGAVDVVVATPSGQTRLEDAYVYDLDSMFGQEGFYDDEIAYVAITNDYLSCFGGVGHPSGDCSNWAISGMTGLDGQAEVMDFTYPRAHAPYTGYRNGFGGVTDVSWEQWTVEAPPYDVNTLDLDDLYADLRVEIQNFKVRNVDVTEALSEDERKVCQDMRPFAEIYTEGFTDGLMNSELDDCSVSYGREYDYGEVDYCQIPDYELARSYRYQPDWAVPDNFFQGVNGAGRLSDDEVPRIEVSIPEIGVDGAIVTLPEPAVFYGTEGFPYGTWDGYWESVYDEETLTSLSLLFGLGATCPDSDGDGVTEAEDVAAVWEWQPVDWDSLLADKPMGDSVVDFRSYVRVSISSFQDGWLGLSGNPVRATITVPDAYNVDPETGRSRLELPAGVLYQFPSAMQDKGSYFLFDGLTQLAETGWYTWQWGDPARPNYGMMFATLERVTEYKIRTESGGSLILAYTTGDLGYTAYATHNTGEVSFNDQGKPRYYYDTSFVNGPVDGTDCSNCVDGDGDGWTDIEDPDCIYGDTESGYGDTTCNDGIDNDGDGLVDAEDDNCATALDDETNCSDGEDNDEDGWVDADDPDCADGGVGESGYGDSSCNDGTDDDGDGWVDAEDPDCLAAGDTESGYDAEASCNDGVDDDGDGWVDAEDPDCETAGDTEQGYAGYLCNDGEDNDGHGDPDALDYTCLVEGATHVREEPIMRGTCANGTDDDGDGYIDANDPDCERDGEEVDASWAPGSEVVVPACYDGEDNDNDGLIDSDDPDCTNDAGEADGWVNDESGA